MGEAPQAMRKACLDEQSVVELAQMTERNGVIFLDDNAAPAGCDGAPYSGHFSRRQDVPGLRSWSSDATMPFFSAASAIRFAAPDVGQKLRNFN